MATSVDDVNILVLGSPELGDDLSHWVESHPHVAHAATVEDALRRLREESFDVVVCRTGDFPTLRGAQLTGEAAAVLDGVSQGVGIVGESGALDWANPKLLSLPADVREQVCRYCTETLHWAREEARAGTASIRGRRFSFTTPNKVHYEVAATPVIDLHRRVTQVAAVVWDTTTAMRLQDKIDAIDRAGRELLNLDDDQMSRLDLQERLALLEQKILRCTSELLHFDNFEIRILNTRTNQLESVLAHGMPERVTDDTIYASAERNGIRGYVAARGKSYICPDVSRDPRYVPAIEHARSSLTIPLYLHDQVVGVANFESTKLAAFNEHDRQFAEIFGRYIALSLHILKLLVTERQATTGQLGSNVMSEINGPLNDIMTAVENLVEDYIGHDDLRHRLRAISENAVRIRERVKDMTSCQQGLLGAGQPLKKCHDETLSGKRVLIADDEDMIRDTVRDVLAGYGCEVQTASDGATAIELIGEHPFDLVLSDIRMPRNNGYEVFAAAKDANPATPVILTTGFGYDPNHSIVRARREGLAAVLFKPFKVDQLLDEIRMALRAPAT